MTARRGLRAPYRDGRALRPIRLLAVAARSSNADAISNPPPFARCMLQVARRGVPRGERHLADLSPASRNGYNELSSSSAKARGSARLRASRPSTSSTAPGAKPIDFKARSTLDFARSPFETSRARPRDTGTRSYAREGRPRPAPPSRSRLFRSAVPSLPFRNASASSPSPKRRALAPARRRL